MSLSISELKPTFLSLSSKTPRANMWNNDVYMGVFHQVGTRDGRVAAREMNPNASTMLMSDKQLKMKYPDTVKNMKPWQSS